VKFNISYGKKTLASDEEIVAAAKSACAHDFIMALPKGYDTDIGRSGGLLSGGQKARLGLARALVKSPSILLLDEVTASLDAESEKEIIDVLIRLGKTMTIVAFTHSEAIMKICTNIYVIDEGRVEQVGTFKDLASVKGDRLGL